MAARSSFRNVIVDERDVGGSCTMAGKSHVDGVLTNGVGLVEAVRIEHGSRKVGEQVYLTTFNPLVKAENVGLF